ncbi:MAG: DUF4148 domain-containing protein [Glaciimonas sp.]|nr:DUF4148 domain-containing protein [Glaciimonas sp.]
MNTKQSIKQLLASLIILTAAGSALAEAPYPADVPFTSTKTRVEVQAELVQAKKQGLVNINKAVYPVTQITPALTQEQQTLLNSDKTQNIYQGK